MYDADDDPDRLYYSRGLGRLDSEEDSGDEDSDVPGEGDDAWDEIEVRTTSDLERGCSQLINVEVECVEPRY